MNKVLLIILAVAVVMGMMLFGQYNGLVAQDESCNTAWANVETVLQRRFDLIPNLVNTVKGYASHEKELLEEITRLRSQWGSAKTQEDKSRAGSMLESALGRLIVVSENYPDLKANQNFMALQDELAGTENRISVERRRYNEAVRGYNVRIRKIPTVFFAGMMGFNPRKPFEAVEGAEQSPNVSF